MTSPLTFRPSVLDSRALVLSSPLVSCRIREHQAGGRKADLQQAADRLLAARKDQSLLRVQQPAVHESREGHSVEVPRRISIPIHTI